MQAYVHFIGIIIIIIIITIIIIINELTSDYGGVNSEDYNDTTQNNEKRRVTARKLSCASKAS